MKEKEKRIQTLFDCFNTGGMTLNEYLAVQAPYWTLSIAFYYFYKFDFNFMKVDLLTIEYMKSVLVRIDHMGVDLRQHAKLISASGEVCSYSVPFSCTSGYLVADNWQIL